MSGMDLNLVASKVKGEEDTTVDLEIQRGEQIISKTITRKNIKINNIKSEVLDENIGYIQILSFDDGCSNQFKSSLNDLISKGIKSVIIDIRNNGGGIVKEATDIADLFIAKNNTIMREIDKEGKEEVVIADKDPIINSEIKVVILTNENSASASEILVGALKDNNAVTVVGTKTFGKGIMQELVPVSSGGVLKLTIKEFRTPNGNKINKEGIKPDIEVKDIENNDIDEQLQKAIDELKNN